jgi:hypothetical protein
MRNQPTLQVNSVEGAVPINLPICTWESRQSDVAASMHSRKLSSAGCLLTGARTKVWVIGGLEKSYPVLSLGSCSLDTVGRPMVP